MRLEDEKSRIDGTPDAVSTISLGWRQYSDHDLWVNVVTASLT